MSEWRDSLYTLFFSVHTVVQHIKTTIPLGKSDIINGISTVIKFASLDIFTDMQYKGQL